MVIIMLIAMVMILTALMIRTISWTPVCFQMNSY